MSQNLGQLERVDIRSIWRVEPEFSKWLSAQENLDKLGTTIGVDMLLEETEASVGSFSADILAQEDGGDRRIIIENQYGCSNHDHLGKVITYASGRSARILVWIVEEAREEHRSAVQWLNENLSEEIGIFLVKIEVYRIGDSAPAPMFTIMEQPNNWSRETHANHVTLTDTKLKQQDIWQSFQDYALEKRSDYKALFNRRQASPHHWIYLPIGSSNYYIALTLFSKSPRHIGAEVYFHRSKELFAAFESQKAEIEKELGFEMTWEPLPSRLGARARITKVIDYENPACQKEIFDWFCDKAVALKRVFPKYAE